MDDNVSQFVLITDASSEKARQYLNISENNLEQAIQLFFDTGGADLIDHTQAAAPAASSGTTPPVPPPDTRPGRSREDVIELDSDDEMQGTERDTNPAVAASSAAGNAGSIEESDEAMARRLQEEIYGETGFSGGAGAAVDEVDEDGYRAPIARTRETLVGPDPYLTPEDAMEAAVMEQLARREQARHRKVICHEV